MNAGILWCNSGFVEYRLPNYLKEGQVPREIQISMEISSEAPGVAENWPSDLSFYFNDTRPGSWTSPGDFGEVRGLYTPEWWFANWNQCGLRKLRSVNAANAGGLTLFGHGFGNYNQDIRARVIYGAPRDAKA